MINKSKEENIKLKNSLSDETNINSNIHLKNNEINIFNEKNSYKLNNISNISKNNNELNDTNINIKSKSIFISKTYIEDNYIKYLGEDTILFNGKVSKKYNRANSYQTKDNIIRIIYKFINYRKYEKFRIGISNKTYYNATIIYTLPNQNKKKDIISK